MSSKRNLLILAYDYPPSTGGVARLCSEITKGMHSYYASVTVMTIDYGGNNNATYHDIKASFIKLPPKRIVCEFKAIAELRKLKNKNSYDVLCGVWHPEALLALLGGMRSIFVLGHGTEFLSGTSKFRKKFWLPIYGKWMLKRVSRVITNSKYTQSLVNTISPEIKCSSLPLGVNHHFFKPSKFKKRHDDRLEIATVSRVLKFKGHDFILKTLEQLPSKYRNRIQWNIAGTGPYLQELKQLASKSVISEQIHFEGFVPDNELPDFYCKNDLFILATRASGQSTEVEGFGLVFLEAQSCGVPAIGTRTGGIFDAISHDDGGWLIAQDDEKELQNKIIELLEHPNIVAEQSRKARKRVLMECTWENYCENLSKTMSV